MAAVKGSRALYGTKAAQENTRKIERRKEAQIPFYEISHTFDDGVSRTWTEDNPTYKPTRGGSKLPGTRARMKAAEKLLKETGDDNVSRADILNALDGVTNNMKKGGKVKKMAKGGSTASKRGDGIATQGKTKGRFI
jgi:hypothetical protein